MNISNDQFKPLMHSEIIGIGAQDENGASFSGSSVAPNNPHPQIAIGKKFTSRPALPIIERIAVLFSQVTNPEGFIAMLVKAFTDSDTSSAERLISMYGADVLSKCTCSFSFSNKTYPNITPFALACRTGNLEIVRALYVDQKQLNQAFDCINGVNGRTALMLAIMKGHVEVVKQLLEWGADPQVEDSIGENVDCMNIYFNMDNAPAKEQIEELLKSHRDKEGLPQYDVDSDPKAMRCNIQ